MPRLHENPGFSLIELLVVLTILGLALAIIPPLLNNVIKSAQVKNAARELASGLRQVRSIAISRQEESYLAIDIADETFTINGKNKKLDLPDNTKITLTTAKSEQQSKTRGAIRFFPDGSSTGGRIMLRAAAGRYSIDVSWLTGQISITPG